MAGKGGGAWKVAYADFVTAMMAFFLVMWIVAQNKPVKESVAGYFRDPSNSNGGKSMLPGKSDTMLPKPGGGLAPNSKAPLRIATTRVKPEKGARHERGPTATDKPRLGGLIDGDRFGVGTVVPFSGDSIELEDAAKKVLDELADELSGKRSKIEVRGHAAPRGLARQGASGNPWSVSYDRALAAMQYLAQRGIDPRRVRLSQSAANEPLLGVTETALDSPNSFVEVYVLNEVVSDPGDGPKAGDADKKQQLKDRFRPKKLPGLNQTSGG